MVQKNKPHKPGRRAGLSAREKHRRSKSVQPRKNTHAAAIFHSKHNKLNAAKQQRDQKRDALLSKRRQVGAPRVVAVLNMSEDVDVALFWKTVLRTIDKPQPSYSTSDVVMSDQDTGNSYPLLPTLSGLPSGQKHQVYWLPPPKELRDPFALVDIARQAEAIVLVFSKTGEIDEVGELALTILKEMGLPTLFPVVLPPSGAPMKVRAASKKLATAALDLQGIMDQKVFLADTTTDYEQLLRHLSEVDCKVPLWRQQRPSLLIEEAKFLSSAPDGVGTLILRGFVRALGLSANQALHIPGAGDYQIDRIEGPSRPDPRVGGGTKRGREVCEDRMEEEGGPPAVLASANLEEREGLERQNVPNPLDAEQTWPTEEELAAAAMDIEGRKRKLPKGTSPYQAAWILDDEFSDEELEEVDLVSPSTATASQKQALGGVETESGDWEEDMDDTETAFGNDDSDFGSGNAKKPSRQDQDEDFRFPDEIDTPADIPAKQRFVKYRGLKSWRTSAWDPKESLPRDYSKIYAFQNIKKAEKRAKDLAVRVGGVGDSHGVSPGTFVDVHVSQVSLEVANSIVLRVEASQQANALPLQAFGLLQHETKLSVLNFGIKKTATFQEPLANKQELLFVAGYRSFTAKPIFSTDEHGANKFKMERFLQPGQHAIATVYAPIAHPPVSLLAFQKSEATGAYSLAASGALRSCNPDRVVVKRIVLSGYPVKVHKKKAVVRWMFHNPEDVRWFRPVELWTKHGLRGRIREPVGTHGAMKCIFDGAVTQQDAVCASLYKRVFPKWPQSMQFAAAP